MFQNWANEISQALDAFEPPAIRDVEVIFTADTELIDDDGFYATRDDAKTIIETIFRTYPVTRVVELDHYPDVHIVVVHYASILVGSMVTFFTPKEIA